MKNAEGLLSIGVTGVGGFIGKRVVEMAIQRGWRIVGFSRNPTRPLNGCAEIRAFAPGTPIDASGLDAVIHLAGESVLGIWTARKKQAIRDSRVMGTRSVVEGLRHCSGKPVLISASAIGYYGNTGDDLIDETASPGIGFLADVSRSWENESMKAEKDGCRVVLLRIGFVLGSTGGAMIPLRRVFGLGLGGRLGNGQQWMSLVHVDDVASMALWAIENTHAQGAYNATMPQPLRNAEFTRLVARILHRPAICHAPKMAIKLVLGELATLLLDSHRIAPYRALADGYNFLYPDPAEAIADSLSR